MLDNRNSTDNWSRTLTTAHCRHVSPLMSLYTTLFVRPTVYMFFCSFNISIYVFTVLYDDFLPIEYKTTHILCKQFGFDEN